MEQLIYISEKFKTLKIGKIPLYLIVLVFVFLLAVLQDYIYSRIKQTGFYLSESLLYNVFWAVFIPLTIFINRLIKIVNPKNKLGKISLNLVAGITFSFIHIILFTSLFVLVSNLIYKPSHRFLSILNTVFSNQFYIALLWYTIFSSMCIFRKNKTKLTTHFAEKIKLKIGSKIINIFTSSIQVISTDKPYAVIYTQNQKFLESTPLKEFEKKLDPTIFLRVHRSSIINATYIKELKSRSNGDYDAKLKSGKIIRLSRHYRNNWNHLLQ